MKTIVAVLIILSTFCGCGTKHQPLEQAANFRKKLISAEHCSFQTTITADYGEILHSFQLDCSLDDSGNLIFCVLEPDTISGISGYISKDNAALTFDDKVLAFPMLADGQISPVCSPWLFINALRSGYISGCSQEEAGLCVYIDDSFSDHPLSLEIYTDANCFPVHADFIWQNRRILSLDIENFIIQ